MKLNLTFFALVGIIFLSTTSLKAQTTTDSFTPSHLKAAEQYLIATGINTQFEGIIDNMISASSAQIPEAQRPTFLKVMKVFMSKYYTWDTLKDRFAKLYASELSEVELNQLSTFYNSPIGKKISSKTPLLMQKSMAIGQQTIAVHRSELEQMMKDAFQTIEAPAKQ
ncbi:DUF2059 domain-containing protein [Mucilaginibacter sp.]|uniref:DUF2059 domain-containing protein n=1 Tax=Mucilaginibacter sp. TaxID=1882438 RepID=UPI0025D44B42|nr:DUF2059 domain-containing protein [Mucilaginibacter sp.]